MKNCRRKRQLAPYYKLFSFCFALQQFGFRLNIRNRYSTEHIQCEKKTSTQSHTMSKQKKTTASDLIIIRQMEQRAISQARIDVYCHCVHHY